MPLLDAQLVLWALSDSPRLREKARGLTAEVSQAARSKLALLTADRVLLDLARANTVDATV